jgi:hypothetical protein
MNNDPPTNFGARKLRKLLLWIIATIFLLAVILVTFIVGTYVWIFYQAGKEADFVLKVADEGFKKQKLQLIPKNCALGRLKKFQNGTQTQISSCPIRKFLPTS